MNEQECCRGELLSDRREAEEKLQLRRGSGRKRRDRRRRSPRPHLVVWLQARVLGWWGRLIGKLETWGPVLCSLVGVLAGDCCVGWL